MQTRRRIIYTADARLALANPGAGSRVTVTGYALVWNLLSSDRGGFKVRLLPGSARFATPTFALWHHEWRDVLGSTGNGTLRLAPDDFGVRVEIDLPDTSAGRDVAELVRRGDVRGMSFAMVDDPRSKRTTEGGQVIRVDEDYLVDEVTITAVPAFEQTSVGVKPGEPLIESPPPVLAPAAYAARTAHRHQLQRFPLNLYGPSGAEPPRAAV